MDDEELYTLPKLQIAQWRFLLQQGIDVDDGQHIKDLLIKELQADSTCPGLPVLLPR